MKKAIMYKNEECVFIQTIKISDNHFTFFVAVDSKKIIYLKESEVHGRLTYVSLEKLVHLFPKYQSAAIFNTKVLLDTFVNTINYKISTGQIASSDEILEIIYQFEKIMADPYIKRMTNENATLIFNKQAMFEVTNTIKKLDGKFKKTSLADLLLTNDEKDNDVFLSANWLDGNSNKDYVYECLKKSHDAHKRSPIDFLFNNRVLNVYMIIVVVSVVGFVSCLSMLQEWKRTGAETEDQIETIQEEALVQPMEDVEVDDQGEIDLPDVMSSNYNPSNYNSNKTSNGNGGGNGGSRFGSDYSSYNTQKISTVDFNALKKKNKDTVAWIYVPNTKVNYPVVQQHNNSYYLNHSFNKKANVAGWIFADYRDSFTTFKRNTVIYGHGRTDDVMFGSLEWTLKESWYKNKNNHIIQLLTPTHNTYWQIVSIYVIKQESYYLSVNFENNTTFKKWIDTMVKRSKYNFGVSTSVNDRFLTLSTCKDYKGNRIVVQAKLIKSIKR